MATVGLPSTCSSATAQEAPTWWQSWTEKHRQAKKRQLISRGALTRGGDQTEFVEHLAPTKLQLEEEEPDQNLEKNENRKERNMSSQNGIRMYQDSQELNSVISKDANSQTH